MNQLRIILQSKYFLGLIIIISCLYVITITKLIPYKSIYSEDTKTFIGKVVKIKETSYGYSLTLKSKENLIIYTDNFNYKLGDTILIHGNLSKPKNNTVLNTFNYKEYLYQNKIFYTLEANEIKLLKENKNLIYKLKNNLIKYLNTFKSSNYLKSFILGDTNSLGNIYNSYQINGICHLLSIGSSHITLLSILLLFILKKIKLQKCSYPIVFIIIFLYIVLTDYQIPILRVYLYLIISYLNKILKLNLSSLKLFIYTTIITLIINPFYIYHKGFLYSYSISFIFILNKDKLNGNYLTKLLKITTISFLYSIPFNIYFNFEINLLSIFYNLFFVPLFNIIIFPLSLLTLIFPFLDNLFYLIMTISNNISIFLNNYTWGIIIFKKISFLILTLYLLLMTLIIKDLLNKKIKGLIILILIFLIHFHINDIIKNTFFIAIDVKQGDSSLFYSNNKSVLIDTGGVYNQNISENTIIMLKSLGIRKIDYLILTHGDFDHMGDSIYLVNSFKVENVILNNDDYNDLEQKLIKVLKKKNINYYQNIKELNIGNNKLYFLNHKLYDNENDNSSVIYTEVNNYKFLLMGDASKEVEEEILSKYNLIDIDILKVGHHGSKTSSSEDFINSITPKYSIISVGENNRYGHPNDIVLDNLEKSKIYRTDQNGSIIFKIKKNKLEIKTCTP